MFGPGAGQSGDPRTIDNAGQTQSQRERRSCACGEERRIRRFSGAVGDWSDARHPASLKERVRGLMAGSPAKADKRETVSDSTEGDTGEGE